MTEAAPTAPAHVSYSQLSSWLRCGKAYELERVLRVPVAPTWAQVAGSAVHRATELLDEGDTTAPRDLWYDVFTETIELAEESSGVERTDWRASGRKSKTCPDGEDGRWWWHKGVVMVQSWKAWRLANKHLVIASVTNEEGTRSGIELPLNIKFGDINVQAVLDRLFVDEDGHALVVDLKSGSWAPKDAGQQLGLYATGVEQTYGFRPRTGAYWMSRTGTYSTPTPIPLDHFSQHYWTVVTGQLAAAKREGIFLPNPGMFCGSCSVRDYCATQGGKLAGIADILSSDR